jgi:RNA polymerase sigma factor (sigma-70 family)
VGDRPLDDSELVELARRGDVSAYEQLVQIHQNVARRVAYLVTRSSADADDAAQEAFVKAYYALGRFRRGAPFRPWLLRIVANEARNQVRSATRRESLALRAGEGRASGGAVPSPEEAALEDEARAALLRAVEGLSDADRTVVSLRYFLELSEAETAEVLGCARGTVKSRLSRALGRLRVELGEGPPATSAPGSGSV